MSSGLAQPRLWPILTDSDRSAIQRVLDRGVLSGAGAPEMKALEGEFASTIGARFCLATNSGTSALHIALAAAGVGPGDEVIVPAGREALRAEGVEAVVDTWADGFERAWNAILRGVGREDPPLGALPYGWVARSTFSARRRSARAAASRRASAAANARSSPSAILSAIAEAR